jgi:hypothetical protein
VDGPTLKCGTLKFPDDKNVVEGSSVGPIDL